MVPLVVVLLLQAHLGVHHIGEGDADHQDRPGVGICKVQPFRNLQLNSEESCEICGELKHLAEILRPIKYGMNV
jgi:hypothetical protein